MARNAIPRLLVAVATMAAIVAAVAALTGTGFADTAAQAQYGPTNTAPPAISGTPEVGQTLTASPGTWNGTTTPRFTYQWQRCDAQGNTCASIAGATTQTYTVQSADAAATLRVAVAATDSSGSNSATSSQTGVVSQPGAQGAIKLQNGQTSIPASSVSLPARLIIDGVKFAPNRITSRSTFVGRFHVSDTRGNVVRDALVKVTGLPYAWARAGVEVRTDQTGWASIAIAPTRTMPIGQRNALVMFVRARVDGQALLAGSSTRRLVQTLIR
jgi:hypothetical protein